jgi:hypothetical protein
VSRKRVALVAHAFVGWATCGATIELGRQVFSMQTTLILHAVVAPLAFAALAWRYVRAYPRASSVAVSGTMFSVVVGLDAFFVAPFLEHSYAMFHSVLGTWIPFGLILVASYAGARSAGSRSTKATGRMRGAAS